MNKKCIGLVGPRSIGKSSITSKLANKLNFDFLNTDSYCEEKLKGNGFDGISDYVEKNGWGNYPKLQLKYFKKLVRLFKKGNIIIDFGGGIIAGEVNETIEMSEIANNFCFIVLLIPYINKKQSIELLAKRERSREHWKGIEFSKIYHNTKCAYESRIPYLKKNANLIIYCEEKSVEEIVKEIYLKIK